MKLPKTGVEKKTKVYIIVWCVFGLASTSITIGRVKVGSMIGLTLNAFTLMLKENENMLFNIWYQHLSLS